ncbi:MAG TPA: DUF362 domain-containing protein [Spirochaetota bacterium]|nr:DUF362 domain-containing protein [Spirochaetota bacterium]HNT12475.1 DUF362 domain-containing protein [Spirochaetota bacterium]
MKKVFRREFIRNAFLALGAITLADVIAAIGPLFAKPTTTKRPSNAAGAANTVIVVKGGDLSKATIERMVRTGMAELGGIQRFVKKGMNVVIKPNIGWASKPERAHNTNPHLVEAVAAMCVKAGARVTIMDRPVHAVDRCYRLSGIQDAAKRCGAKMVAMDKRKFKEVPVKGGLSLSTVEVYEDILNADLVINIPIAKHHGSGTVTLAMKNLMGAIGGSRGKYHIGNLHENIVDFTKAIPTGLVIIDALRVLLDNGPSGGSAKDIAEPRTILFGTNPVTMDAYATRFLNRQPSSVEHIRLAGREGMGVIDPAKMRIVNKAV